MLRPMRIVPVPPETARVAGAAFPQGSRYLRLADALDTSFTDCAFRALFPPGQPAWRPWRLLRRVILPAASPSMVTGLRISLAIALILVTTAEMIAGGNGVGFLILDEERSLRHRHMYAGIMVVSLLGYVLNRLFLLVAARVMRWRKGMSAREEF